MTFNIWITNSNIDKIILDKNFEYKGKFGNYLVLFKDEDLFDNEIIIINNNTDEHIYLSVRKNLKIETDPNNFKIGILKENVKTFIFHSNTLKKFIDMLHTNNVNICAILNNIQDGYLNCFDIAPSEK